MRVQALLVYLVEALLHVQAQLVYALLVLACSAMVQQPLGGATSWWSERT